MNVDAAVRGAPVAPRVRHVSVAHGDERSDDWWWLRDRDDPAVIACLEAENAYADAVLADSFDLQRRLLEELRGRMHESDSSAPARKGDWWYYTRTIEGLHHEVHCRRHDPDHTLTPQDVLAQADAAGAQVILDENALAGTNPYFALGVLNLSPDQSVIAHASDRTGAERYTLRFRDLATGKDRPDVIEGVSYSSAWSTDSRSFFYVRADDAMRAHQVWRHVLGEAGADELVYEEADERFSVQVGLTRSERFVVITATSKTTSEVWVVEAACPLDPPRLVARRREGIQHAVEHAVVPGLGDAWLVLDNEGAENFALYCAPVADTRRTSWRLLLPHRASVKLETVDAFATHAVVVEREDGLRHLNVVRLADGASHRLPQPEPIYSVSSADSLELCSSTVRFAYTSLVTPRSTIEYDLVTGERTVVKQEQVRGGWDPAAYEVERLWAPTADGTRVPISVVHARHLRRDGRAPCLLYGYGAYGVSIEPTFSPAVIGLLERGFVFAIAHVRGGGELGRHWHDEGKLAHKGSSFTDFIACAEHLVTSGYTCAEKLAIRGRSAGGLLVGAVANMRPDLFAAVVAEVPFVDCLTTMLDDTLPFTVTEREEWGNPAADPVAYARLKSYSPYDNVAPRDHPAIYATAARNDQRVGFWEPLKWVNRLRERNTGDRPILLGVDLGAGHGGPSDKHAAWRDEARIQAFILRAVGVSD